MSTKNRYGIKSATRVSEEHHSDISAPRLPKAVRTTLISLSMMIGLIILIVLFFRFDQSNDLTRLIQRTGALGIFVAIFLMAMFSILPVPSEFLMIIILKIFGVVLGTVLSFGGTMIAAIVTFFIARRFGRRMLPSFIPMRRVDDIASWIGRRGVVGLILVRIIPFPFIVVNYTAGLIRTVKASDFIWTSAVGGIPYYLGAALVFLGVSKKYMTWLIVGGVALVCIWIAGYIFNRHVSVFKRWSH